MHLHGNLLFNSDVQNPCRIELLGDWLRIMETASASDADTACHSGGGSSGLENDWVIVSVEAAEMRTWRPVVLQKWRRIVLRKIVGRHWAALGSLLREAKASCNKIRRSDAQDDS